ncbi:GNAT family N-acetyltransferase [Rhizobium ruizarguesonis]|uniref:GNAT family N-acetyltransferase n=1 Tax=Rhizobium ruizarguesonis TaxID=2081791 RepID=A0AAE8QAK3_9HYPH|nr:GNAT family N-acetyltransferase [Rhizobium ruizarguesonis]TBY59118.1 GNAT family N-acetyltransferase [Rhizobium leguminosarum bv. viciae]TAW55561.1 GNAT family N-acetyltransferase [Rhizobium ruizarguesonis]TBA79481.1 GNAT family N-acetyltransferase [Rhizobium ruizarguesonis]TBB21061.1 GNAT family N-acetyltransferase [Rhizobium ruizarguesonis]
MGGRDSAPLTSAALRSRQGSRPFVGRLFSLRAWTIIRRGVAILPARQGKGLGSRLVEACLRHANDHGATLIWCSVRSAFSFTNPSASVSWDLYGSEKLRRYGICVYDTIRCRSAPATAGTCQERQRCKQP